MSDKPTFTQFIVEEAKKWAVRVLFLGLASFLIFLFTPFKDRAAQVWHSPDTLKIITEKIDRLTTEVQRATGEDRVIYETPGLSYVREPVYRGDPITLHLVVRRTRVGAACRLVSRTALFTDESNIASAGEPVPPTRQVTTAEATLRLILDVPPQVAPGRVTVSLSLEFDCGGKRVFDATRPVAFQLLPQP